MSKSGKLVITLLVILNITTLFFLWRNTKPMQVRGEHDRPRPEEYMKKRLGLTDDQLAKLEQSRRRHFERIAPLENELRETRNKLFMTQTLHPDTVALQIDLQRIGYLQRTIDSLTYAHFMDIRSFCTSEQAEHLARMMQDVAERRFGPRRGGEGRPKEPGRE